MIMDTTTTTEKPPPSVEWKDVEMGEPKASLWNSCIKPFNAPTNAILIKEMKDAAPQQLRIWSDRVGNYIDDLCRSMYRQKKVVKEEDVDDENGEDEDDEDDDDWEEGDEEEEEEEEDEDDEENQEEEKKEEEEEEGEEEPWLLKTLRRRIGRIPGDVDYKLSRLQEILIESLDSDSSTPLCLRPVLEQYRTSIVPLLIQFEEYLKTLPNKIQLRVSESNLYSLSEHMARELGMSNSMQPILVDMSFQELRDLWEAENGPVGPNIKKRSVFSNIGIPMFYDVKDQLIAYISSRFNPEEVWRKFVERMDVIEKKYPHLCMHLYHMRVMNYTSMKLSWSNR